MSALTEAEQDALDALHPEEQEREWAAMRQDRDQFERRALVAETELRETAGELERALQTIGSRRLERTAFLRQATIALKTARWPSGQVLPEEACWREARELWDTKPEDC